MLAVVFLLYSIVFAVDKLANATTTPISTPDAQTIEKATAEFMANICAEHGGINCSEINSGFSVVCNDGTIDESPVSIFSIPQCQETINNLVDQQSDLMAETGCYPPSEITCIDQKSYNDTFRRLDSVGLVNSELGKIELGECWKEVLAYRDKNSDYKQCLAENNIAPINLPGDRLALPILKAIFCPMFYGKNASYDSDLDLCVCDPGYFKYNGACAEQSSVCKLKYGSNSYVQNGYCIHPIQSPLNSLNPGLSVQIKNTRLPSNAANNSPYPVPSLTVQISPSQTNQGLDKNISEPPPSIIVPDISPQNILKNIITSIVSGIKNIFRIFR